MAHEIIQSLSEETRPGPDNVPVPNPQLTLNPRTGKPYHGTTIHRLINSIREDARRFDAQVVNERMGQVIAALDELFRIAMGRQTYKEARLILVDKANILGGYVPEVIAHVDLNRIDALIEEQHQLLLAAALRERDIVDGVARVIEENEDVSVGVA